MSTLKLFFGGSFDPIHLGHLTSAERLLEITQAQDITLLPNALSPLKSRQHIPPHQRKQLLELALQQYPNLKLDWREVERGGHSFTSDTLQELSLQYPNNPIGFVMGLDSFNYLDRWHNWQQLSDYAHLIVIARPGYQLHMSKPLKQWLNARLCHNVAELDQSKAGKVYFCELQPMDISSSKIRENIASQVNLHTLEDMLPADLISYIVQHKLYGA
ncbi:nicotinate-nucleotide adenylyltransferase [Agarivorans sp. TSD2052]|uniref:nicotinate-nucleotide adenylyltransferase n=1 Tax=Agarivorans sp. TSD2052 TaxID=2937286 RepID=UPI00200CBEB6|nr:nicotinate-nucleotide adenylyltransferase [Agarivorans sp. TSD2052]UPW19894.1 nicotinate-nucleotide adenylyltransferase [Agarivorans sp. TSD2052]